MKVVSVAPRSSRLSSCSLPRLRSQPIHTRSPRVQTRRRWSRRSAGRRLPLAMALVEHLRCRRSPPASSASSPATLLAVGVGPVGQQREIELAIGRGQVMDFEPLRSTARRVGLVRSASWAPRPACAATRARRRAAPGPAAMVGANSTRHGPVDQSDRDVHRWDELQQREPPERGSSRMPRACRPSNGALSNSAPSSVIAAM